MNLRELCKSLDISRRRIQGYEKAGLVAPSGKNKYGHLLYDESAIELIGRIRLYQEFGFELKEIKELINAPDEKLKAALIKQVEILEKRGERIGELIDEARKIIEGL